MLECEGGATEANSNCKHCQASGESQQRYWDIQLDQDLLETICGIYPEWFKDCNMNLAETKAKPGDHKDRNKESFKSSASFHESKKKLERSKMGDILKHKIQKRPDRQEVTHDDSCLSDNNQEERQRQLKRARLAEDLTTRPGPLEVIKVNILHSDEALAQAVRESSFPSLCDTPSPPFRLGLEDDSGSDGAFSPSPPFDCSEHSQGSLPSLDANECSPPPHQGSPCSGGAFSMSPPSSASSPLSILVSPPSAQEQIYDLMAHVQLQQQQQQQLSCREALANKNRKKAKPKAQPKARTIKFHEYKGPPNAQKNSNHSSSTASTEPSYDLLLQQQQLQLQWQLEWLQKNPQAVLHTPQKPNGDQIVQVSQKVTPSSHSQQQVFDAPASPQRLLSKLEDMKVSDLKTELKKRNLPVSGSKPTLIERLKSHSEMSSSMINSNGDSSQQLSVHQLLDNLTTAVPATSDASATNFLAPAETCSADTVKGLLTAGQGSVVSLDLERPVTEIELGDIVSDSSSTSLTNEDIVQLQQRFIERLQRELERSQQQLQQSKQSLLSQPALSTSTSPSTTSARDPTSSPNPASGHQTDQSDTSQAPESKPIPRQLIHQYLQQKIQHQQLQQKLLHEVQQKQAQMNALMSSETVSHPKSTLTALLERQPMNATSVDLDLVVAEAFSTPSKEPTTIDSTVLDLAEDPTYPGVVAIKEVADPEQLDFGMVSPLMVDSIASAQPVDGGKSTMVSVPEALSSRSSSLPSFSALVSCKPPPPRSNTDPQFIITRPPPDYDEATKHLKVKQALSSDDVNVHDNSVQKTSLNSQAVDDVLEILIKNGELPPSAAQEVTSAKSESSPPMPIFTTCNDTFFSKPLTITTSMVSQTTAQPTAHQEAIAESPDLHMSLQSILELTPPSSAGFGDTSSAPTSSLDFDFSLDMPDIEGMDLDGLDGGQVSSPPQTQVVATVKSVKQPGMEFLQDNCSGSLSASRPSVPDREPERSIDMDLMQWLEVLGESSAAQPTSSSQRNSSSTYDQDPLFSTSALDLFASEDMDLKPQPDLTFLPWGDKADFSL